jgi:hypothetical protein
MAKTRKLRKPKVYKIHDNGGRPFFVEIHGNRVSVSKNMDTFKVVDGEFIDIPAPAKPLFTKTVDEIFIGKKSPTGGYDGLTPSEAEGNSILLKIGSKYLYIGDEIYEFVPMEGDTIVSYYSNIGNNDVPYPYAVGKTHVYIMLDKKAVEKSYFDFKPDIDDIYTQYYYDTYVRDCQNGFGDKLLCKDKDYVKARLAELKAKTHPLKAKLLVKRA